MDQLASFACQPKQTRGRLYKEVEVGNRSVFRRDCDRIIHSTAFRRLEYKTQVFVNHEGDHYRTRLTHSLEVAQIARSVCRSLQLNEDMGETLALAHDLGHTPFGHAGEDALDEAMKDYGGFSHNAQTLKILTHLEQRYAEFDGLNLTWETLEGIVKHNGPLKGKYKDKKRYEEGIPAYIIEYNKVNDLQLETFASAEAQVAATADDIAYNNHDIDDGLRAKLFTIEQLIEVPFVGTIFKEVMANYPDISSSRLRHEAIRRMIWRMIHDLVQNTKANIKKYNIQTTDDVRNLHCPLVCFSSEMEQYHQLLKKFLMENMYRHYKISRMTTKAKRLVKEMFTMLYENPSCLPDGWRHAELITDKQKKAIIIADFIAGMTDRFAIEEHNRLFDLAQLTS